MGEERASMREHKEACIKRGAKVGVSVAVILAVGMLAIAADAWNYVDDYAPIVEFNTLIVDVYPTGFQGDYSGYCTYVNVKSEYSAYIFQYWFYYRYDIRLSRTVDAALKQLLDWANRNTINSREFEEAVDNLFHEHDWELVEVHVSTLGSMPNRISYYSHGSRYDLTPNSPPFWTPMQGNHCVVKVITDMHGSYPAGIWSPVLAGWGSWKANLEFALAGAWEHLAGYAPEFGYAPGYKQLDFSSRCRRFSSTMMRVHSLSGYPYALPWDRGFNY